MASSYNKSFVSIPSCVIVFLCCLGAGSSASANSYKPEKNSQGSGSTFVLTDNDNETKSKEALVASAPTDPQEYRSVHYFPSHHQEKYPGGGPVWNRDSYAEAANDFGYSPDADHQVQHGFQHHLPSPSYGAYGGQDSDDGYSDFDGFGGIGGIGGLAGLLGLKGLKGLGLLGLLKAGILPFLFLLLPALLLLLPLLLFFLPIPVITVPTPAAGRGFGMDAKEIGGRMSSLTRSVLDSDKCIERITCEMSLYSRGTFVDKTLKRMIFKFEQHMPSPLQRMARAYSEPATGSGCRVYSCFLMDDLLTMKHKKST